MKTNPRASNLHLQNLHLHNLHLENLPLPYLRLLRRVAHLSDDMLLARIRHLAGRERRTTALLVAHLAEIEKRRLHLREGCTSLFAYCTQVLDLSEYAAYGRIAAARAAQRFPGILALLADGSVTVTAVELLAPHLTEANHQAVLAAARHRRTREIKELVAQLDPQPPVPALVRRLPVPRATMGPAPAGPVSAGPAPGAVPTGAGREAAAPELSPDAGTSSGGIALDLSADRSVPASQPTAVTAGLTAGSPPHRPTTITPLAPERYRIQFTATAETCAKLRQAQALLRHRIPDGDLAAIFDRALAVLVTQLLKQKAAVTDHPRTKRTANVHERSDAAPSPTKPSIPRSRHIPAEVRRLVWARDGGRCAFTSPDGRRCAADGFLEFHHKIAYAAGGEATIENIELRCRSHNGYESELVFGHGNDGGAREDTETYTVLAGVPHAVRTRVRRRGDRRSSSYPEARRRVGSPTPSPGGNPRSSPAGSPDCRA